jgi:hypothetical protein
MQQKVQKYKSLEISFHLSGTICKDTVALRVIQYDDADCR